MTTYADSLALSEGFTKLECPPTSSYPTIIKKLDGLQDPDDWLVDYLETVKLMGGT
jgi:hypothetical protein